MSKAERTRRYIVERTAPLFNRQGYAGTSLSEMEAATGLTKGAIYGHFQNKDEVALAAFDHNLRRLTDALSARVAAAEGSIGKLLVFPRYYRGAFPDLLQEGGCPIANTATEADDTHPALRQRVQSALRRWERSLTGIIEDGIAAAEIRPGVEAARSARLIITLIEGAVLLAKATAQPDYLYEALDRVERFIREEMATGETG